MALRASMVGPMTPEETRLAQSQIEAFYKEGGLTSSLYYQSMVLIAHDFACIHLDTEGALIALNEIPPEFFETELVGLMELNRGFAKSTIELTYRLIQLGITLDNPVELTNMGAANA